MTSSQPFAVLDTDILSSLVVTRGLFTGAERTAFYRQVNAGRFTRVIRGVYLATDVWTRLDRHARYRAVTLAVASRYEGTVFSHQSAAALWRLPWVGPWPTRAHVLAFPRAGGSSTRFVVRHTLGIPDELVEIDGCTTTTLARTVVDVATVASFGQAVTVADAALRRTNHPPHGLPAAQLTRQDLLDELERAQVTHGSSKARDAVEFSNGLADRPGESMSRVSMRRARLPIPELQVPLRGASGREWSVDFLWRHRNLIGEFDGKWKYTDPEFLAGRTPHEVLLDEKEREDDLRAAGFGLTRWGWEKAVSPTLLRAHFTAAGL